MCLLREKTFFFLHNMYSKMNRLCIVEEGVQKKFSLVYMRVLALHYSVLFLLGLVIITKLASFQFHIRPSLKLDHWYMWRSHFILFIMSITWKMNGTKKVIFEYSIYRMAKISFENNAWELLGWHQKPMVRSFRCTLFHSHSMAMAWWTVSWCCFILFHYIKQMELERDASGFAIKI